MSCGAFRGEPRRLRGITGGQIESTAELAYARPGPVVARAGAPAEEIELHRNRVIVPAAGHPPHQRDRLGIGAPFRATAPWRGDPQLRMAAALPMNHEDDLSRGIIDVDDDLLDQDPDNALFQTHVGRRVIPE